MASPSELPFVFVFAGSMREVEFYRYKEGLAPSQVRMVESSRDLQGYFFHPESVKMPLVGTFWDRRDAVELYETALSRGIDLVEVKI